MSSPLKRCLLLLFFGLATGIQSVQACSEPPLRVALFNFPPFYELGADEIPRGTLVELLDRVVAEAGCGWTHRHYDTAAQLLESLVSGDADLALVIRHPLLEKRATFGTRPVARLRLKTYNLAGVPAVSTLTELRGRRLIVIRGYGYGGLINKLLDPESGITLVVVKNHQEAFEQLLAGRGDYLLDYQGPAAQTLEKVAIPVESTLLVSKDVYFVLSPQLSNPEALLHKLESALSAVQPRPIAAD